MMPSMTAATLRVLSASARSASRRLLADDVASALAATPRNSTVMGPRLPRPQRGGMVFRVQSSEKVPGSCDLKVKLRGYLMGGKGVSIRVQQGYCGGMVIRVQGVTQVPASCDLKGRTVREGRWGHGELMHRSV